jgi:hypothetical protein
MSASETQPECNSNLVELNHTTTIFSAGSSGEQNVGYNGNWKFPENAPPTNVPCWKDLYQTAHIVNGAITFETGSSFVSSNQANTVVSRYYFSAVQDNFPVGSRVRVDIDGTFVRNGPSMSNAVAGSQITSVQGTVTQGGFLDSVGNKIFHSIDFDSGVDGWVPDEHLVLISNPPTPTPTPTATPTPTPTPTPSPTPTPTPTPSPVPLTRKLAQPSSEAKWNALLTQQWSEGYRLRSFDTGSWVTFEKVK